MSFNTVTYGTHTPTQAASQVIFGSPHFMPIARAIQTRPDDEPFMPESLGSHCNTSDRAIARLTRLGFIKRRADRVPNGCRRYLSYVPTRPAGLLDEAINRFYTALDPTASDITHQTLTPVLTDTPPAWYDRVDLDFSQNLCGSSERLKLLVCLYSWPYGRFYIVGQSTGFDSQKIPNLATTGLIAAVPSFDNDAGRPLWYRTGHPLWQLIPLLWRLVTEHSAEHISATPYHTPLRAPE